MLSSNTSAVSGDTTYIEDVFSTYLYTGNSSTQSIVNGIDLATKGGMVWTAARSVADNKRIWDTTRGANKDISTNSTAAQSTRTNALTSFNADGFSLGADSAGVVNATGSGAYASWTFRKQPKFFDCGTYTGNGTAGRTVPHNLGSTPGVIIVKQTSSAGRDWIVYHRSLGATKYMALSQNYAVDTWSIVWNNTEPTSTNFTVGTFDGVNTSGESYVYYAFAHDAGGFGLTGTDNVISCGSMTLSSGTATVNLGYEPQYIMYKRTDAVSNWEIADNMRGLNQSTSGGTWQLSANTTSAEDTSSGVQYVTPTSTGFVFNRGAWASANVIYIAIRRGPMKVPTDGTKVFSANYPTSATFPNFVTSYVVDACLEMRKSGGGGNNDSTRLQGANYLDASSTAAEAANSKFKWDSNTGYGNGYTVSTNTISWDFGRAPQFFDVVCYTGTGSNLTLTHNLGVAPELMIVKSRTQGVDWVAYAAPLGNTGAVFPNRTDANTPLSFWWNSTSPTSTQFTIGTAVSMNNAGDKYVTYLFSTCAGVSKVGSYTGNGSTQTINCGFAAGARFVMIKRTDSTGDWYVWDTARGIVSGNDGHLSLNTTAAEVTTDDTIDADSSGFIVNQLSATNVNVNAATYIYLAIA